MKSDSVYTFGDATVLEISRKTKQKGRREREQRMRSERMNSDTSEDRTLAHNVAYVHDAYMIQIKKVYT